MKLKLIILSFLLSLVIIGIFSLSPFPTKIAKVYGATTSQFYPTLSGDDGYVYGTNTAGDYIEAWTYGDVADNAAAYLYFGQYFKEGSIPPNDDTFKIYRAFLKFDTSSIPDAATITSAKLCLFGYLDKSDVNFMMCIEEWTSDTPISTADYEKWGTLNFGQLSTAGFSTTAYNNITLTNTTTISKTGNTKYILRSEDDVYQVPPSGFGTVNVYVIIYSVDQANADKDPFLEVEYTTNTAPTNDALTLDLTSASYKGTKTLLAGKQDYQFVHKCSDTNGITDITYAEIRLDYATKNVILRATRGSGDVWTFSEQSDPSNYVMLNTGGSSHSTSGNQKTFNYLITINWDWDDASETLGVRCYVIDSQSASDTDDYTNIFGVENDLATSSLAVNDYRCNPSQTLTFSGYWYYEGTSFAPPNGDYQVKIKLSGVQKGSTDSTLVSGAFSVNDVTAQSSVNSYSYTVEATYMSGAGSFSAVIVDRIKVSSYAVSDSRANINDNVNIDATLIYEYSSTAVTTGTITINGYSASHQGSGVYRITRSSSSVTSVTYNTVAGSESTYGLNTVNQNSKSATVIWDRIKVSSYAVSDSRANINDNVNIDATLIYEYSSTAVTTGTITINGYSASHQGSGVYRITRSSSSVTSVTYNTVAGSESTYDLNTVNQNGKSTTVIWDGLSIFNIQAPEYLGNATYIYKAQIEYAFNDSVINGASVNISLPSGSIIGQVTSNSTGWIMFILSQSNATESGSYTIFGVNDNNFGITASTGNQTAILRTWTLNSKDNDGNDLSETSLTISKNSQTVYNGGDDALRAPEDTFNITIIWYSLQVNVTTNLAVSGDTATDFKCLAYPYIYESVRYWVASDATISSVTWSSNVLTIQFSGSPATYILKSSCLTKPSYILNCTYDYDTDWTTMLTLTHYANTTIKIGYPNWGGFYVKKTDHRLINIGWADQALSLTFTGSSGNIGEVQLYCASRGAPAETSGFATTSYSGSTKMFVGTYTFESDKSVGVFWATGGTSSEGGGGGTTFGSLLIYINIVLQPSINAGTQVDGVINVKWSGATIVYVYDVKFGNHTEWFSIAGSLPYKLQKAFGSVQGESEIKVKVNIPSNAVPGNYLIPCMVVFRTEASQDITLGGTLKFEVFGAPSTIPDYMVLVFLGVFALILLGAVTRSKQKP